MAATASHPVEALGASEPRTGAVPWYIWLCVLAVTSAIVGIHWDISWHRSIGRDTFWTPAHVAIYLCGVLAGVFSGYLILSTTFDRNSPLRESAVVMWGFRGPLGAFIAAWGGIAMLVSGPFDNWWHNAYGLDVKIISPPHALLFIGNAAILVGGLILILGQMNRASAALGRKLEWLFLYAGGMLLLLVSIFVVTFSFPNAMHSAMAYRVAATAFPFALLGIGGASHQRWASTKIAALYTAVTLAAVWILPLFPAEPKLGPVYRQITSFVPPPFPLLLIVPAFCLDLVRERMAGRNRMLQSAAAGLVFLGSLMAVEWPFATFLLSPAGRNRLFGTIFIDYSARPDGALSQFRFFDLDKGAFPANLALAVVCAIVTARLGIAWSDSMRRIRR